jgi:hypothetical protein
MWQAPTLEQRASGKELAAWAGLEVKLRKVGGFIHNTTHRAVEFRVWDGGVIGAGSLKKNGRTWVGPQELPKLAMGNAQRRVLRMGPA